MTAGGGRSGAVPSALLAVLTGCFVHDPHDIVTGSWGGEAILLVADESEVRLEFPCMRFGLPGPLVLDATGHFQDTAQVTWQSFPGAVPDHRLALRGDVQAGLMTLTVRHLVDGYVPDPRDYRLYRGAEPDFSGYFCLGAASPAHIREPPLRRVTSR